MVFSLAQINDIIGILTKHKLVFIAEQLGLNYLSQNDKNILTAAGIDLTKYTNSQGQIEHAYLFGLLSEALGDKRAKNMTYAQFQKFIKSGNFIPLTEDEEFALEQLKNRAYTDLNSLGNRIATGTSNVIIKANQTQQNKLRNIVKKKAITAVEHRQTASKLASELGHATDDWERDWLRIAYYLLHEAYNTGRAKSIFKARGEDAEVWFDVLEKACVHCRELYLTDPDDIDSEPIVFKLKDVIANGSNIGRKVKDWKATVGPIHPYCRCTLRNKEPNMEWDRSMHSFSKVKKYVPKNKKLQGIKLNIKVSKSEDEQLFEKAKHQDGDMHPNGKWVWVASAAGGKGDWRVFKAVSKSNYNHQENLKQIIDSINVQIDKILSGYEKDDINDYDIAYKIRDKIIHMAISDLFDDIYMKKFVRNGKLNQKNILWIRGQGLSWIKDRDAVEDMKKYLGIDENSTLKNNIIHKEEFNRLLKSWSQRGGLGFNNSIYDDWHGLTQDEKYEFVKRAKVTGMVVDKDAKNPEDSTFAEWATILVPIDKIDIVRTIDDILMNLNEGYDVEDENHYIVAYKDGGNKIKYVNTSDLNAGDLPDKLPRKNLLWIAANQGLTDDIYWAKDAVAETDMKKYMGCTKYIDGIEQG